MDARFQPHRVDDPKLRDAEARIERGLAPDVVGVARIRDLDDEMGIASTQILKFGLPVKEDKVGFEIGVGRQTESCFVALT